MSAADLGTKGEGRVSAKRPAGRDQPSVGAGKLDPSPSCPAEHWVLLDFARWIAAYAIVWLHAVRSECLSGSAVLARFAVPFFAAACVFLVFQGVWRKPERTFLRYAYGRFVRIYLPFLAWCAVYLGFKVVKGRLLPDQPNDFPTGWEVFWTGTFLHLWFMPFILVVSLAAFLAAKTVIILDRNRGPLRRRSSDVALGLTAIGSLGIGLTLAMPWVTASIFELHPAWNHESARYAIDALPALFWAMALSLACRRNAGTFLRTFHRFGIDVWLFLASMIWLAFYGRSVLFENAAGVSALIIALRPVHQPLPVRIGQWPSLAYGIYLSHLLPIKIFEAVGARAGFSPSWQLDMAVFLGSAFAATLIALILYQTRWTRWLVA